MTDAEIRQQLRIEQLRNAHTSVAVLEPGEPCIWVHSPTGIVEHTPAVFLRYTSISRSTIRIGDRTISTLTRNLMRGPQVPVL